jgi:hypothetical protein
MKSKISVSSLRPTSITFLFITMLLCVITIMLNNIISNSYNVIRKALDIESRLTIFVFTAVIYSIFQFKILSYVEAVSSSIFGNNTKLRIIHTGIKVTQFFILAGIVYIIFQMFLVNTYSLFVVVLLSTVSYCTAIFVIITFSFRFFSWAINDRGKSTVLYAISAIFILVNLTSSLIYEHISLSQTVTSFDIRDHSGNDNKRLVKNLLFDIYLSSTILVFLSNWLASLFLLKNYFQKLPKTLYWTIFAIPLIYFISQYSPFAATFLQQTIVNPIQVIYAYTIIYTVNGVIGGVLIGMSFLIASRKINDDKIKNYLYFATIGYVLLFSGNNIINISILSYPPFGFSGIPYVSLSSYLIFIGVYASALQIAHDNKVRRFIKKEIKEDLILHKMGTQEMYRETQDKILRVSERASREVEEDTGVKPELNDDEIRQYVEDVLSEVRKMKKVKTSDSASEKYSKEE